MTPDALRFFICPECTGETLAVRNASAGETASIECTACGFVAAVKHGIPRFVPQDNYATSFGYQWNLHQRSQLDSYTGVPISRDRLFSVSGWPQRLEGELVLEAGSGAGRFTEVLVSTGATIVSFDYSTAVEANARNNADAPNLVLFQGDIFKTPLKKGIFDKVMCLGVIQHTPDPERAFASLAQHVRPGGEFVIDVYAKTFLSLIHWKYLLRPITKRLSKPALYKTLTNIVPWLVPPTIALRKLFGRAGARLMPIVEYSYLGLPREINTEWAILDTFDMYSPAHDHPQSSETVQGWFERAGFEQVFVGRGPNGVIARGRRKT